MRWKPLKTGDIFEGRYRIEAPLGSGGFSYVYRATQLELGRQVALKVLRPFLQTSDMDAYEREQGRFEWIERFRREAQIVSRLRDPHTITMYEYGQTATGVSFMAFEYIDGRSLSQIIRQESPIAPQRLGLILRQCLSSLQEAHSLGMFHRDIKPANIMLYEHLGRPDQIKVLDFGIAKVLGKDDSGHDDDGFVAELTQAGAILGTPRYMAPEQLRENIVTPASDLYSLALVAYELLTGDRAIGDNETISIIGSQLSSDPIRLPDHANIPYGLATIIHHMLAKNPAARYQDAAEVIEDLDQWLDRYRNPSEPTSLNVRAAVARTSATFAQPAESEFFPDDDPTHHPARPSAPVQPQVRPLPLNPEPVLQPLLAAPPAPRHDKPAKPGHRWLLISASLLIVVGITGFIIQQFLTDTHVDPIQLGSVELAAGATMPDGSTSKSSIESESDSQTAAGFMVIVTDPARAEIFINDKSIGKSPQRFEFKQFNFPIFVKARMPDGREANEALTRPVDLFELRLPPLPEAPSDNLQARPSTQRVAPATKSTARPKPVRKSPPQSASKPPPKSKPKSSFPALDSL